MWGWRVIAIESSTALCYTFGYGTSLRKCPWRTYWNTLSRHIINEACRASLDAFSTWCGLSIVAQWTHVDTHLHIDIGVSIHFDCWCSRTVAGTNFIDWIAVLTTWTVWITFCVTYGKNTEVEVVYKGGIWTGSHAHSHRLIPCVVDEVEVWAGWLTPSSGVSSIEATGAKSDATAWRNSSHRRVMSIVAWICWAF